MNNKLIKHVYQTDDGFSIVRTNLFCSLDFVYCPLTALVESRKDIVATNIDNIPDFIEKMIIHENSVEPKRWKIHHHKYLIKLDIMLDKPRSKEEKAFICEQLAKKYDNLPYFCYSYFKGKSEFIRLFFCERHFIKEGITSEKTYKYGKYIDPNTGRTLKSKRSDSIEVFSKGQTVTSTSFFTNKTKVFVCYTKSQLTYFINNLKEYLSSLYEQLGAKFVDAIPVKKMNYENKPKVCKPVARLWNKTFSLIQDISELLIEKSVSDTYKIGIERLLSCISSERNAGYFVFVKDKNEFSDGQKYLKNINGGLYSDINFYDPDFKTVAIHFLREGFQEFKKKCELYVRHILMLIKEMQTVDFLPKTFDVVGFEKMLNIRGLDFRIKAADFSYSQ